MGTDVSHSQDEVMTASLLTRLAQSCPQLVPFPSIPLLTTLLVLATSTCIKATVLLLPPTQPDVVTFGESRIPDGWTSTGFKLVNSSDSQDSEVRRLSIPSHGMVALPQLSMTGARWAKLVKEIRVAAFMQVNIEFSVYVSGYQKNISTTNLLFDNNPGLELTWGEVEGEGLILANLSTLQPGQTWQRYRALVTTEQGSPKTYHLELRAARGGGMLALDDVSVDLVPLVGEQYVRDEEEEDNGEEANPTGATTGAHDNHNNETEMQPTVPASNQTAVTGESDGRTTIAEGGEEHQDGSEEDQEQPGVGSTAGPQGETTFPGSQPPCPSNSTDCIEAEMVAEGKQDTSVYGYTGEVILICLTVVFAILFLLMVVKYQRLRTHFGDYQLERTSGPAGVRPPEYDNPAYQVQMSYRNGD